MSPRPSLGVKTLEVRLGTAVTLQCDLSHLYEINWLRMSPEMKPELLMVLGLNNDGQLSITWSSNSSSFHGFIQNRLFQLRIERVSDADLVTYFCAAVNENRIEFGEGLRLDGKITGCLVKHHVCWLMRPFLLITFFLGLCSSRLGCAAASRSESHTLPRLRL